MSERSSEHTLQIKSAEYVCLYICFIYVFTMLHILAGNRRSYPCSSWKILVIAIYIYIMPTNPKTYTSYNLHIFVIIYIVLARKNTRGTCSIASHVIITEVVFFWNLREGTPPKKMTLHHCFSLKWPINQPNPPNIPPTSEIMPYESGLHENPLVSLNKALAIKTTKAIQEDGDGGKVVVCRKKTEAIGDGDLHREVDGIL